MSNGDGYFHWKWWIITAVWTLLPGTVQAESPGLLSVDTGYTISKVRTALREGKSLVVASSYDGTVLGIDYDGTVLWKNALSGFMNHDLWCADITRDRTDEVLAANADGTVYCLDADGAPIPTFVHQGRSKPYWPIRMWLDIV